VTYLLIVARIHRVCGLEGRGHVEGDLGRDSLQLGRPRYGVGAVLAQRIHLTGEEKMCGRQE
jgi:hypothetical protein